MITESHCIITVPKTAWHGYYYGMKMKTLSLSRRALNTATANLAACSPPPTARSFCRVTMAWNAPRMLRTT